MYSDRFSYIQIIPIIPRIFADKFVEPQSIIPGCVLTDCQTTTARVYANMVADPKAISAGMYANVFADLQSIIDRMYAGIC